MDTIVAIATPPGYGGVGVIRLSGPDAYLIAMRLTNNQSLTVRKAHYRSLINENGECLDKALVLYFKAPHSFTGEDVIEIQAHGSPVVLQNIVSNCVRLGARLAKPGEFSERAFLNDKIDLTQAEAIADLIHASSDTAARLAVRSLEGEFSKKIEDLSEKITYLRLFVEASIDFPEEEIDFLNDGKIVKALNNLIVALEEIRSQAGQGALLREGATIVLAGRPNAGKSTLINALAGREVAIVTDIAGTTRDIMREQILLDEIPLNLIDTAGLRDSDDVVEKEGIKRAWHAVSQADCVLLIVDISNNIKTSALESDIQAKLPPGTPIVRVVNKIDTLDMSAKREQNTVFVSAKTGDGFHFLKEVIKQSLGFQQTEGVFLARRRHLEALNKAFNYLQTGMEQLNIHRALELLADDLRKAHEALAEITGTFTSDDLLGEIFSSFCIGK